MFARDGKSREKQGVTRHADEEEEDFVYLGSLQRYLPGCFDGISWAMLRNENRTRPQENMNFRLSTTSGGVSFSLHHQKARGTWHAVFEVVGL